MKIRVLSLLCAAVLQILPCARFVYSTAQAVAPESAFIFRWIIGAVAGLGAFDAVSGASTYITSPNNATGTVGQAFSYRITVGPRAATIFKAAPLPDGLYQDRSYILGVPTTPGDTEVKLTASDGSHSVSKWITIHILPPPGAAPPFFVDQPRDQSAVPGEVTTFHSSVRSEVPVTFQWLFNGGIINGATGPDLAFANEPTVFTGLYAVVASSSFGSVTSSAARLFVRVPLVDANGPWTYADMGRNLRSAWRKPAFNDSAWLVGTAPFGFGWGDESTVVSAGPNPARTNVTTYFRHSFFVSDSNAFAGFNLAMQVDDAAVVFLNGRQVLRLNFNARKPVSFRTVALSAREQPSEREWFSTNLFQPLVLTGTNVLAVEVHQAKTNGADLRFDFRFSGLKTAP